jgi:hypothetical protein
MENHQIVLLFGDLNYRINLPNEVVRPAVERKEYDKLLEHDELTASYNLYKTSPEPQFYLYREF